MGTLEVDHKHSSIGFAIKHMKLSKVKGFFESYKATIKTSNVVSLDDLDLLFEIDVASVSTNDFSRDKHLISADFFHADKFPKITFQSTEIEKLTSSAYLLSGLLMIKDKTNLVKFNVLYNGHAISPNGVEVHGFTCISSISRKDYNLLYNALLESGGLLLDDEVEIIVELELFA